VEFKVPKIGKYKEMMSLAHMNAAEYLEKEAKVFTRESEKIAQGLKELEQALALEKLDRIECYDISNIQGTQAVGSMVVFESGVAKKSEYRKFKIKTVKGQNDFAMMKEVLERRFNAAKSNDHKFTKLPDLVLIDGGKGQLSAAKEILDKLKLSLGLASLAKKEEELISYDLNGDFYSVILPKNSQGLYLLQRVRDEAHRFACLYHRQLRSKELTKSALDDVPGIGPKTKKILLEHFGNLSKIKGSDGKEIAKLIGESKYNLIKEYL
jgi:excinuclease ABC subunit C